MLAVSQLFRQNYVMNSENILPEITLEEDAEVQAPDEKLVALTEAETLVLGFDIGGSKTAWGVINQSGELKQSGVYPTPTTKQEFVDEIKNVIQKNPTTAVGIGIAGIISSDHHDLVVSPYLPQLSHSELVKEVEANFNLIATMENDARCALIGEVWLGAAADTTSAVLLTLGTGVGGAVMQKGSVLPHPTDLSKEIGRIMADPSDLFPASAGRGTIEALMGGRNLEERFGAPMEEIIAKARAGEEEALEIVEIISQHLMTCLRAVYEVFSCKRIIIGGKGMNNLDLYLKKNVPCPVMPAMLGEQAGIYGAARLALDALEIHRLDALEWGDPEEG